MSKLVTFWNAVVDALQKGVPELEEVRAYRGEFEGKDKGRVSIRTPGALVAVTGTDVITKRPDGRLQMDVAVAVAIIAEDRRHELDLKVADIAEDIVGFAHQNRFRVDGAVTAASDPDDFSIMNYNSDASLAQGLSIWGVAWRQSIIIGEKQQVDPPGLPDVAPALGNVTPNRPQQDVRDMPTGRLR